MEESRTVIREVFSTPTMWAVELKASGEAIGCVGYCFGTLGLEVLWGDYFTNNSASGRVMSKCGFRDGVA